MIQECEDCKQDILKCDCGLTAFEQTKNAFFMFFMDTLAEYNPTVAKKIPYFEVEEFVDSWIEQNFGDTDEL